MSGVQVKVDGTILFAVLGMSPAVLTETIWGLAHEEPRVVPDRIVVLTTTYGRERLEQELFSGGERSGWEQLRGALAKSGVDVKGRLAFGLASDHVKMFPAADGSGDLADIVSTEDNAAAADFIMRELRSFTEDPSTALLASIAGGRKTMSALLTSCMCLLGRSQDRLLHVLVNAPYDGYLEPTFLFPAQGVEHVDRQGGRFHSSDARVELIDVPFVRMRGWYEGTFHQAPPSYAALVAGVQREAPEPVKLPRLTLEQRSGRLLIEGGGALNLSPTEFGVLTLLWQGVSCHEELAEKMATLAEHKTTPKTPDWVYKMQSGGRFGVQGKGVADVAGVRKCLSSARKKMQKHPVLSGLVERLVPKRGKPIHYPEKLLCVGDV